MNWTFLAAYGYTAALAALLTYPALLLAARLAQARGLTDVPGPRKIHLRPMPLAGWGLFPVFLAVTLGNFLLLRQLAGGPEVSSLLPAELAAAARRAGAALPQLAVLAAGGLGMTLIGLADDAGLVSVPARLAAQFAVAAGVAAGGLTARLDFLSFLPGGAEAATVLWLVGVTNAFNLIDSLDGLMAGVALIAALFLAWIMAAGNQPLVALLLAALAGSLAAALALNFRPARLFLGSAGAMFTGYLLAVACLVGSFVQAASPTLFPVLMPIFILGLPLYDMATVVAARLGRGRSIFRGDLGHLPHRLLRLGLSHRQAVLFLYLIAFCTGINATLLAGSAAPACVVLVVQILATFGIVALLEIQFARRLWPPGWTAFAVQVEERSGRRFPAVASQLAGDLLAVTADDPGTLDLSAGNAYTLHFPAGEKTPPPVAARLAGAQRRDEGDWMLRFVLLDLDPEERLRLEKQA